MAGKNAAMDIAAIKQLFSNISDACEMLGIDNIYKINLCDYEYAEDGTLREWSDENASDSYGHRHLSQIYALMPGREAMHNEKLRQGIEKSIGKRIQNGFFTPESGTCGWSVMHLLCAYARLGDKHGYGNAYDFFINHYIRENLTSCLGDRVTYQIDANLGFVGAVTSALVYTELNTVVLLPSLPDFAGGGRAEGIPLHGGITLELLEWNTDTVRAVISGRGEIAVRCGDKEKTLSLSGSAEEVIFDLHE